MSNDPWPRVKQVLAAALEARPEDRAALIDTLCAGDTWLRSEVDSLDEIREEPEGPLHVELYVLTARARIAMGGLAGAEVALSAARRIAKSTERIELKRALTMAEAELDTAQRHPERARQRLTALRATLDRAGMTLAERECRMALARLDGEPRTASLAAQP